MARAYGSAVIKAPIEVVWGIVRDFNGLPNWADGIAKSKIEDKLDADVVGSIRALELTDGRIVRERLLSLDDARHTLSYNFETPAYPVENYIATMRLMPVTRDDTTFAEWEASFDEAPGDKGKYEKIISAEVFAANWASLRRKLKAEKPKVPEGAERWKGGQPNKVWTSAVINGPVDQVWARIRDFAGMADWHNEISAMHMKKKHRSDKVSGVRDFMFGAAHLNEELLHLDDLEHSFSYRITKSEDPWVHYVSGPRLWPISADNTTFAVWTGDWIASPTDDLVLIPRTEYNVYQKAFATLNEKYFGKGKKGH